MAVIMCKELVVPELVKGKMLGDYTEGDIVLLDENGNPVEFYVAEHDYYSGYNGTGRTLLVRKDCHSKRQWHSSDVNKYAESDIDAWLNSEYKAMLSRKVQSAIGETMIAYDPRLSANNINVMTRSVFILSLYELGKNANYAYGLGTTVPTASLLRPAYMNGAAVDQWTRSARNTDNNYAYYLNASSAAAYTNCSKSLGIRPCVTMPVTALFNPTTNAFLKAGGAA